jgi:hypothetical protein
MVNLVPKYYINDPDTEVLLPNGRLLRDGMKVLIESANMRVDIDLDLKPWEYHRALQRNRWGTLSNIEWITGADGETVARFAVTYDDGSQMLDTWNVSYAWYVKKDTIDLRENHRYHKIRKLVTEGMDDAISAMNADDPYDCKMDHLTSRTDEITRQILDLL